MELDTRIPTPEILSQEEIERLLTQVADEASHATIHRGDGLREKRPRESLPTHDFRAPAFLTQQQWRKLRLEQEDFVRSLSGRLTNYLRLEVSLRISRLETMAYRDLVTSRTEPSHFVLFKLEPLRGICLMEMSPHLGLTIVDRMLGGPGQASSVTRDLSEIERALLDQILLMTLAEWSQRWSKAQVLSPMVLGHETSGRYLQSAPADTMFLVLAIETRLGNCADEFVLAFPCASLEPLVRQLNPPLEAMPAAAERAAKPKPKWPAAFNTISVPLSAQWPARLVSARQLTQLKVGDVIEWDANATTQVQVCLAQTAKFIGQLGAKDGRWAIEITGPVPGKAA
jgi:flagellar motor switch protein FliM